MAVERRGPTVGNDANETEGKGEMIKTPSSLQDLRKSLYVKAKAEPTWRFWGLYVHVSRWKRSKKLTGWRRIMTELRALTG
jgi:hypothetical protein